jgi:MoaA/NifB/PqqE/SkfB family radical SAM enzyme
MVKNFYRCEEIRKEILQKESIMVPPIMILSITHLCNLKCKGCFAAALGNVSEMEEQTVQPHMTIEDWDRVITEAAELGVYSFLIAGGEPFVFKGLLDLCAKHDDKLFLIFTNGTAVGDGDYKKLKKMTNTGIVVSVEGSKEITDDRRGEGVYDRAVNTAKKLGKAGILSGISVTITNKNYDYWMRDESVDEFIDEGLHLAFLTEYIPVAASESEKLKKDSTCSTSDPKISKELCLTSEQRKSFRKKVLEYKDEKQLFIIHSPGDEELFGGCVSSGKGFAHINSLGDLTPCPVSDIATHNMRKATLKEGLASKLFVELRENGHILENTDGPCALFEHQEEVEALRKKLGAYKTGV